MKVVKVLLLIFFAMALVGVAIVVVLFIVFFRSHAIAFDEDLERAQYVEPAREEAISIRSFDVSPDGTEIYYLESNFLYSQDARGVYVRDLETNTTRELVALQPDLFLFKSRVTVIDDEQILVVAHGGRTSDSTIAYIVDPEGVPQSTFSPTPDEPSFCTNLTSNPADFRFYGFETSGLGRAEDMVLSPMVAIETATEQFVLISDCSDDNVEAIAADLERYWPENTTNFEAMRVVEKGNSLSFAGQSDVIVSDPRSPTLLANLPCEHYTDFVVKIDEKGYEGPRTCAGGIHELPSSLRFSGEVFVIEGDHVLGLS